MSNKLKKIVDENNEHQNPELDLVDRSISDIYDVPGLCKNFFETFFSNPFLKFYFKRI